MTRTPTQIRRATSSSHKVDSGRAFLYTKVVPIFIIWFGISLSISRLGSILSSDILNTLRLNYIELVEWHLIAIVVVGGVLGYLIFVTLAALGYRGNDNYRDWYKAEVAQEIIGTVMNVAMAAFYSPIFFGAPKINILAAIMAIGVSFGAWKAFCFKE